MSRPRAIETVNQPHIYSYENLRNIRKIGRKKWKQESGYYRHSLSETTMFRLQTIFGGSLKRHNFDAQTVKLQRIAGL